MSFSNLLILLFTLLAIASSEPKPVIFREYIGSEGNNVTFSDVPINPNVEFHYILAFASDYTNLSSPLPTNGQFNVFWDTDNLGPSQIRSIKSQHSNVKVAVSLGGDTVNKATLNFSVNSSMDLWVSNAVSSLTNITQEYNLDGIDIDYEHFLTDSYTFCECIGRLITTLKNNGAISFASIAPFEDDQVQSHYLALWKNYSHLIDYVNFQFYAYDKRTNVTQFMKYFQTQRENYGGGNVLASLTTDGDGGLSPDNGFFTACDLLKSQGDLSGIFIWSADFSKALGFRYENLSQALLTIPTL